MKKLSLSFYRRTDVVKIAKELLGKIVYTKIAGDITSGRIVETEAYVAIIDKASHSFGGRRTSKNEHMYEPAGTTYVYICYGMHQMLNIVTNEKDIPDAVLIRAVEPILGIDVMLKRTGKISIDATLTKGLGMWERHWVFQKKHSGRLLDGDEIFIYSDENSAIKENDIGSSKRIGVESAGADGMLPYRFYIKGNIFVSGRPVK